MSPTELLPNAPGPQAAPTAHTGRSNSDPVTTIGPTR